MDCRISNRLIDVTKERMKCLSQEEINIQEKTSLDVCFTHL